MSSAQIRVYGAPPTVMNTVARIGAPAIANFRNNTVFVDAGDAINGMSRVFSGAISQCWQDFSGSPDTFLNIICYSGLYDAMAPAAALSFNGAADVATIMSGIAQRMTPPRQFENNGVQVQLQNQYLPGTLLEQAHALARAANINMHDDGTTLAIWPLFGARGGVSPVISPQSGMVGYPQFYDFGMKFRTIYNPSIIFNGPIQMQSSITPANGTWYVNGLSHDLSAQTVNGPWFTDCTCYRQAGVAAR